MNVIARRLGHHIVSLIIVVMLATQAVAGFVDTGRWGWPMLAYPMYKTPHYDGERLDVDLVTYAIFSDGTRTRIDREALGMSFWIYWYNVVQPIRHDKLEVLRPIIERYCRTSDGALVQLIAEDLGIAITRSGLTYGLPPKIIYSTDVFCD